jgi:hypothetical protein
VARRLLIAASLLLASTALLARTLVAATVTTADSPFVALSAGHVGQPYSDTTSDVFAGAYPTAKTPFKNYAIASGVLPAGLSLDATAGVVSGTPIVARSAALRVTAEDSTGASYAVRADITIFTANESEIVSGQSFAATGPYTVNQRSTTMTWVSSFDGNSYAANVMIFQPTGTTGQLPVLCHHRGRGFTFDNYVGLLSHIASYGFICASIDDPQSFYDPSNTAVLNATYDGTTGANTYDMGMENASAAQQGLFDYILGLSTTTGDPLFGVVDNTNIFVCGHSRGGGATQASHQRSLATRIKGVVYYMAFDLRDDAEVVAPTTAPVYPITTIAPRLPALIFSAENDGDLAYPFADQFIDRASGPTTFATVYGATHQDLTDNETDDGDSVIGRTAEQQRVANLVVAFMKRWSQQDVSVDGLLYGGELASSGQYGVASWRRTSPTLYVDNFQNANPAINLLNGAVGVTGMTRTDASIYPIQDDFGTLGIKNCIMEFSAATAELDESLNGSCDVSRDRNVLVRVEQQGTAGWKLNAWVKLTDAHGNTASVQYAEASGATMGYLPATNSGPSSATGFSRFITLVIPLYQFERAAPAIDLTSINKVSMVYGVTPGTTPEVAIDDIRFE